MADRATLLALVVRCETEGPSRLLDLDIGCLVREGRLMDRRRLPRKLSDDFDPPESIWPKFTSSLDAAVTLVPENNWWSLQTMRREISTAWVGPYNDPIGFKVKHNGQSATPALALCAASLRARAEALPEPPPAHP